MTQDTAGARPAPAADAVKILIDSPSKQPSLSFDATACALAQIIRDSPPRFAVGIFGAWGSGKTTLMDEIRRKLGKTVVPVEFNAWRYEREPQLLIPLLDTVRGALVEWAAEKDADTRELGRLRREIRRVRGIQSPTDTDRDALGRTASDVVSKLEQQLSPSLPGIPATMPALLAEIRTVIDPLMPTPSSGVAPTGDTGQLVTDSSARLEDVATRIYRALRVARNALAPTLLS